MINSQYFNNPLVKLTRGPDGEACQHLLSEADRLALEAALVTGRPLLLTGEPGCGKSQLAWAAAAALERRLHVSTIDSTAEKEDLLYKFDAVERLAQAQLMSALDKDEIKPDFLNDCNYIKPGPLWWAFDGIGAEKWLCEANEAKGKPSEQSIKSGCLFPGKGSSEAQAVLLIDEIDKASSDLPNALLEALGNRSFRVAETGEVIRCKGDPLVLIASNDDRELPAAFVRRCLVHHMGYPSEADADEFQEWFMERAKPHWQTLLQDADDSRKLALDAVELIRGFREQHPNARPKPGLAEYIDLLKALKLHTRLPESNAETRAKLMKQLSALVLHKQQNTAP